MIEASDDLTPKQREAVYSNDPHVVVTAAAGSGKTRVLVERYMRLVEEGTRPDQILTITFTRKAAAEMKSRIVNKLTQAGRWEDAQIAETGPIQTIHGFCERILRENAISAGLDPRFGILDQREKGSLESKCILSALADPLGIEDEDRSIEELVQLLAGRRNAMNSESPHSKLIQSVSGLLKNLRGTDYSPQRLLEEAADPDALEKLWRERIIGELPIPVRAVLDHQKPFGQGLREAYKHAKIASPVWLKALGDHDSDVARHTCAMMRIAASAWSQMEAEMLRRAKLDFVLLERLAVELLDNPEVRDRLSRQFIAVFVDEAQDLNPMQYRLVDRLSIPTQLLVGDVNQSIYGFRLADSHLFADHPKRRNVEPICLTRNHRSDEGILAFVDKVFADLLPEYQPMLEKAAVIEEGQVEEMLESAKEPSFDGVEAWPFESDDLNGTALLVRDLVTEYGPKGTCILVRKTKHGIGLLDRLTRLGVRAKLAGGTDQYYTRMEIRDVANALRALCNPYDDFALLATLRSPFAGISLDAFVMLAMPGSEQRTVFERLVEAELPESDRQIVSRFLLWFDSLRRYGDRLAAWEAISELFASSPYMENLAKRPNHRQLIANARKLLSLAAAAPETGPEEFAEQVRETQRLRHSEGEAPIDDEDDETVTIMTVHKAKGLEFDTVVVPETLVPVKKQPYDDVLADPRSGMIVVKLAGLNTVYAEYAKESHANRSAQEEWRVLYVALTRAKKRMCVVVHPKGRPELPGGKIARTIGLKDDEVPAGLRVRKVPMSGPIQG